MIQNFSIFNRWGEIVFDVHDVLPGDVSSGWNGSFRAMPSLVGNYVYMITLTLAGGEQQIFNGTVLLLR